MKDGAYKLVFILLFTAVIFMLVRDLLTAIISSFVLSFLLLPLYRLFCKKIPRRISAIMTVLIFVLVILGVVFYLVYMAAQELQTYVTAENIRGILQAFGNLIPEEIPLDIPALAQQAAEALGSLSLSILSSIPQILISLVITVFLMYYFLINWEKISEFLIGLIPFRNRDRVINDIGNSARKIIYGYTIVAALDFTVAAIGFRLAGVEIYIFLALVIGVAAYIPMFGPVAVWFPLFLLNIFQGDTQAAIIILVTGLILTFIIDDLIAYLLVGKTAAINPGIMLVGVIGGIALFGILGFIIGPLVLVTFIAFLREFSRQSRI